MPGARSTAMRRSAWCRFRAVSVFVLAAAIPAPSVAGDEVAARRQELDFGRIVRRDSDLVALGLGLAEAVLFVQFDRVASVGREDQRLLEFRIRSERELFGLLSLQDEKGFF